MYYDITFKGINTHDPEKAIRRYLEAVGIEPSVIIVRPNYPVKTENPLIVRSEFGAGTMMLVTHEITQDEAERREMKYKSQMNGPEELNVFIPDSGSGTSSGVRVLEVEKPRREAPRKKPVCPHCGNLVHNYEALGWWWGWELGKEPDYWDELRLYVFRRDDFTCAVCEERLPASQLQAHHVKRKEDGGTDSARNLMTLCEKCHLDNKPIYPTE